MTFTLPGSVPDRFTTAPVPGHEAFFSDMPVLASIILDYPDNATIAAQRDGIAIYQILPALEPTAVHDPGEHTELTELTAAPITPTGTLQLGGGHGVWLDMRRDRDGGKG